MPFCGKCGRKLEFGELCDCEQKKTPSAAKPAEEFFSLVGKAIDEAEDTPLLEDDDMKIVRVGTKKNSSVNLATIVYKKKD